MESVENVIGNRVNFVKQLFVYTFAHGSSNLSNLGSRQIRRTVTVTFGTSEQRVNSIIG